MVPVNLGVRERVGESEHDISHFWCKAGVQVGIAFDGAIKLFLRTLKPPTALKFQKFKTDKIPKISKFHLGRNQLQANML
jgi:hypothetical protein